MRAELGLPSVKGDDEHGGGMTGGFGGSMGGAQGGGKGKRPISVKFEIPYFTTSGIQVRYLKIIEPKASPIIPSFSAFEIFFPFSKRFLLFFSFSLFVFRWLSRRSYCGSCFVTFVWPSPHWPLCTDFPRFAQALQLLTRITLNSFIPMAEFMPNPTCWSGRVHCRRAKSLSCLHTRYCFTQSDERRRSPAFQFSLFLLCVCLLSGHTILIELHTWQLTQALLAAISVPPMGPLYHAIRGYSCATARCPMTKTTLSLLASNFFPRRWT